MARKRRTQDELCTDLRKERGGLYAKRSRFLKKLQKKLSKKETLAVERKYASVQKRLDYIKEKLFKCGKKYGKFKSQRLKLRRHQHYLAKKIKKGRLNGMSNRELNQIGVEERKTLEAIHLVEKAMKLPIGTIRSGSTGFLALKDGKFVEQEIIFQLTNHFQMWMNSGYFETLVLDDELYDMSENPMEALAAIYQAYDWAVAWQHIYGSPFYFAFGDANNAYLEIKVKKYTTEMYKDEINRAGGNIHV